MTIRGGAEGRDTLDELVQARLRWTPRCITISRSCWPHVEECGRKAWSPHASFAALVSDNLTLASHSRSLSIGLLPKVMVDTSPLEPAQFPPSMFSNARNIVFTGNPTFTNHSTDRRTSVLTSESFDEGMIGLVLCMH